MAIVHVDMSSKSKFNGAPVPDGEYTCEVLSIAEGESKNTKSPQLNVVLRVVDPEQYAGGQLTDFITLSDNAMFRRADFFWALGVEEEGEVDVDTASFCRLDDEGNEIQEQGTLIRVTKRTSKETDNQGQERTRIRLFYNRATTEETTEAAPASTTTKTTAPKPTATAPTKKAVSGKRSVKV